MKFLHTADLHLDSAFCALGETDAQARRARQRSVLAKIFDLAKAEQCDMMLIAGDLFDSVLISPETRSLCLKLFEDFKNPIIISPGNHDPFVDGSFYKDKGIPENVYVFSSSELQYFDFPKLSTTVAGYAFLAAAMPDNPLKAPAPVRHNERILLLCAHTELGVPTSRYAPALISDIIRYRFDYAALGHVHKHEIFAENVAYCGFPEGRGFDEQGEGGVMIVSTDGISAPVIKRVTVSERRYISAELSADGINTQEELAAALSSAIRAHSGHGLTELRIELTGNVAPEAIEELDSLKQSLSEGLASLEIIDSTLSLPDKSFLEKDPTLKGEFYRSLRSELYSDDPKTRDRALRSLKIGLAAIDGKSFTDGDR